MGILAIFAFVVIGSAQDVYLGSFFVIYDPIFVAAITFLIALFVLQAGFYLFSRDSLRTIILHKSTLFWFNLVTAMNWISFFIALKYLEPGIVGAVAFSVGPSMVLIYERYILLDKKRVKVSNWVSSFGIILSGIFLGTLSVSGGSGIVRGDFIMILLALGLALLSGIGMTINTYIAKELSNSNLSSKTITAFRFPLLVFIASVWSLINGSIYSSIQLNFVISTLIVGVVGIVLPMTLIQFGIKYARPKVTSIVLSLTPAVTFAFEAFDQRIAFSFASMLGIVFCCMFSVLGLLTKEPA